MNSRILIVDDDQVFNDFLNTMLTKNGFQCVSTYEAVDTLMHLERGATPDAILLDIDLGSVSGIELCKEIRSKNEYKAIPIIFVTGTEREDRIVSCYEVGGVDYVGKPIRNFELLAKLQVHLRVSAFENRLTEVENENRNLKEKLLSDKPERPEVFSKIITNHPDMVRMFRYIEVIAPTSKPVLICGETGTGKDLVGAAVHELSGRSGELITVNVAGLDDHLFSDVLFGHEKGAFTGAADRRSGLVERAKDGTLFLDEIGDLRQESQLKLLRLLENCDYYPIGSDDPKFSGARVVAATNRDMFRRLEDGQFREDLYYRLMTHQITIPPLRERRADLALLLDHFAKQASNDLNRQHPTIPRELPTLLSHYHFPGNVRELQAWIFDAISRSEGKQLDVGYFHDRLSTARRRKGNSDTASDFGERLDQLNLTDIPTLKEITDLYVDHTLRIEGGNVAKAAKRLGISKQSLYNRKKGE